MPKHDLIVKDGLYRVQMHGYPPREYHAPDAHIAKLKYLGDIGLDYLTYAPECEVYVIWRPVRQSDLQ